MKKKILIALSYVLIVALAITGTIAYLQDTDEDVNVMTLGNVHIAQHEYERVVKADGTYEMITSAKYGEGYKLQEFTQAKPLYPATGAISGWGTKVPFDQIKGASGAQAVFAGLNNVQDKFVLVENTGKSDAYVRTLIALEYGSNTKDIIGISIGDFWTWNEIGVVEINSNNYLLFEAIYKGSDTRHINGVLPAGEYTYSSLNQIYMVNEATNEDCEALDGNKNGTYDILVLSQAIQTNGFETAETALDTGFGDVTEENVQKWFGADEFEVPAVASTADDLKDALADGENVVLKKDIVLTEVLDIKEDANIDLNGKTLTVKELKSTDANADISIKGGTLVHGKNTYPAVSVTDGNLTMEDVTVICNEYCNLYTNKDVEAAEYVGIQIWGGDVELNNCSIVAKADKVRYANSVYGVGMHGGKLTMNGGSITVVNPGSTKVNYEAAISAGTTSSELTLNNVTLNLESDAEYLHLFRNGSIVVNTTAAEGSVTDSMIKTFDGAGTYTINYID